MLRLGIEVVLKVIQHPNSASTQPYPGHCSRGGLVVLAGEVGGVLAVGNGRLGAVEHLHGMRSTWSLAALRAVSC
jgi:hypothetical protein